MRLPIDHWAFSFSVAALVAVAGLINSLFLPWEMSFDLLRENGLIENATVVFYFAALAVLWLAAPPGLERLSRIAISIVLLACAARELELHTALFGMSILKLNFYRRHATGTQATVALLLIFPVLLSIGFLLMRHSRWLLDGMRRRYAAAMTTWCILMLLVVVKILDASMRTVKEFGFDDAVLTVRTIQRSLEEPLEMILPLLVVVAIAQEWRAQYCGHRAVLPQETEA